MKTSIFKNSNKNTVSISEIFCSFLEDFWGISGGFLEAFWGFLGTVSNIINKEVYRKPQKASKKPQGSYTNFQGRNPYNIFVAISENGCPHKLIMSLTDL